MFGLRPRRDDDQYYRRQDARERALERRRRAIAADLPRRTAIIRRAEAGEITWHEAERQIKFGSPEAQQE